MSKTPIFDSSPASDKPSFKEHLAVSPGTTPIATAKSKMPVTTKAAGGTPPKSPGETEKRIPLSSVTLAGATPIDGKGVAKRLVLGDRASTVYSQLDTAYCATLELVGTKIVVDGMYHMPIGSGCIVGYVLA